MHPLSSHGKRRSRFKAIRLISAVTTSAVSVGGGSVIDTAKAVCVTLKNGGCCNDNISWARLNEPQTPHIVIPTTSGTGSEVTWAAVIKNKVAGRKSYIIESRIAPNVAILDPRFTMTLPPGLTVGTAMDAMTHAAGDPVVLYNARPVSGPEEILELYRQVY